MSHNKYTIAHLANHFNVLIDNLEEFRENRSFIDYNEIDKIVSYIYSIKDKAIEETQKSTMVKYSESKYLTPSYLNLRRRIFNKYKTECMKCNATSNLQLDHIKPVSKYPNLFLDINNMQILCKECNKEKSNINEIDYRGIRENNYHWF